MTLTSRRFPLVPLAGLAVVLSAQGLQAEPVADFALADTNTTSPRYGQLVSPRDYRHQVTAYYFGDPL